MIRKILNIFKNLETITNKIIKIGFKFCFLLASISCIILIFYILQSLSPLVFYIGISIFKLSTYFFVEFIVCGLVVDSIKKQIL